jgi:hypothetical protein
MAEEQAHHRQRLESMVVQGDITAQRLGLIVGGTVAVVIAAVAGIVALWADPWAGAAVGGIDIAGIVGAFVYGQREKSQELERNR